MTVPKNEIPAPPRLAPGMENARFLSETEVLKISIHHRNQDIIREAIAKNKVIDENLIMKQQICDLTKQNYIQQQKQNSEQLLQYEKRMDQINEQYELGLRTDIKTRLNIPKERGFSYDPNNFLVTIEGESSLN